jgi:hypothetical protein
MSRNARLSSEEITNPSKIISERERRKLGGGSERHYRLEGGVTET